MGGDMYTDRRRRPERLENDRFRLSPRRLIHRHCEERSDEAIQGLSTVLAALDCFAAKRRLAMTRKLACL
jgi:hypothetical protein